MAARFCCVSLDNFDSMATIARHAKTASRTGKRSSKKLICRPKFSECKDFMICKVNVARGDKCSGRCKGKVFSR